MQFLVDAQLPPALARWITANGFHAVHVVDVDLRDATDTEIWQYAIQNSFVIITKDEDFALRVINNSTSPVIVWLRIGNCTKTQLILWFTPLFPAAVAALESGETLIELTGE